MRRAGIWVIAGLLVAVSVKSDAGVIRHGKCMTVNNKASSEEKGDPLYTSVFAYRFGDGGDFRAMCSDASASGWSLDPEGQINYSIETTFVGGILNQNLSLWSDTAFGDLTIVNYVKQNIGSNSGNLSVAFSSDSSAAGVQVFDSSEARFTHMVDVSAFENISSISWKAYSTDQSMSCSGGMGCQDLLPSISFLPELTMQGENADMVSILAFKVGAGSTRAGLLIGSHQGLQSVPEPATAALFGIATVAGFIVRRILYI